MSTPIDNPSLRRNSIIERPSTLSIRSSTSDSATKPFIRSTTKKVTAEYHNKDGSDSVVGNDVEDS